MSRVRVLLASLPALVVGLLAPPPAARAWQTHLENQYANFVSDVTIGGDGSIVACGISDFVNYVGRSFVVKLAVDGTVVWRVNVDGYSSRAETIQVDAHGDVLVGGLAGGQAEDDLGHFVAVKLAAATGAEIWRYEDPDAVAGRMALDGAGDVVAGVEEAIFDPVNEGYTVRTFCRKLAGADGTVQWEHEGCGEVYAVDADGNALAADFRDVQKIAGSDGHELWRTTVPISSPFAGISRLSIDASGDVAVAAGRDVAALAGDGSVRWYRTFTSFGGIRALAIDADGNVAVAGTTKTRPTGTDFEVLKLDARHGHRRWRRVIASRNRDFGSTYDAASAVAFDPGGDVVATGWLGAGFSGSAPIVLKLGARNGHTVWQATLHGDGGPNALAVDTTGTIAVAGNIFLPGDDPEPTEFAVARLGRDGDGATDPPRVY